MLSKSREFSQNGGVVVFGEMAGEGFFHPCVYGKSVHAVETIEHKAVCHLIAHAGQGLYFFQSFFGGKKRERGKIELSAAHGFGGGDNIRSTVATAQGGEVRLSEL